MRLPNASETASNADWPRSRRSVVIDFEGVGRKRDGTLPPPILLGALVPPIHDGRPRYHAYLLCKELAPMTRPSLPGIRPVATLDEAVAEVADLANEREATIAAFSEHEAKIIDAHCRPDVALRALQSYEDVRKLARKVANQRGLEHQGDLESLLRALKPRWANPPPPSCGVAESCRRLVRAGSRSHRWRRWSPSEQQLARDLLRYNRGDCTATRKLLRHCSWVLTRRFP